AGPYFSPNPSVRHEQVQPDDLPSDGICLCARPVHVLERPLKIVLYCRHAEDEPLSHCLSEMRVHEYRTVSKRAAQWEGEAIPLRHMWQRMGSRTLSATAFSHHRDSPKTLQFLYERRTPKASQILGIEAIAKYD